MAIKSKAGTIINGIEIIAYRKSIDIDIKFSDGTILTNVELGNLKKGSIKNPMNPIIYGLGFIGIGNYTYTKDIRPYKVWNGMLKRCYCEKNFVFHPTYKDCSVHPDWLNFQNFAKWYYENYKEGFQLDKDLLVEGNRVYSAETCCFVPRELNNIISNVRDTKSETPLGVYPFKNKFRASVNQCGKRLFLGTFDDQMDAFYAYKKAKELFIRKQAEKYRMQIGGIVYSNLINYVINP